MANSHLYLTRANGRVFPYYNCTTAPTLAAKDRMSGDFRNIFKVDDLQTDLKISNYTGGGVTPAHITVSPQRGGYTLKPDTVIGKDTTSQILTVLDTDLQVLLSDEMAGVDLRQSTLQITHWVFTIALSSGTMEIPVEVMEGDTISPAPPIGYRDANAPALI
jgi:hypothetical protein